jgi:hypothetical protein
MPEVADVLRRDGAAYRQRFGEALLPSQRRAIDDLLRCRTEALGGQWLQCDHWGQEPDVYHCCRTRSGPKCHQQDTEAWLAERRQELLPVPSFHVVFTVPHERGEILRQHQQALYDILLRAAAQALINLAADAPYGGGLIGVLCVLPTWTRTLADPPHVHGLVPAGGVSADRTEWRPARTSYVVPVPALSKLFRGLFLDLVRQERPALTLPESVWTKGGGSTAHRPCKARNRSSTTWAGTVHRLALPNRRLLSSEDGDVCFRYQDAQDQRWKSMTLPALECIRRFLQHVLPEGFHKVRSDGLWRPVPRSLLHQLPLCLARHAAAPPPSTPEPAPQATDAWGPPIRAGPPCPSCGQGLLVVMRSIPRLQRGPP